MAQRLAIDKLSRDETSIARRADLINCEDVRMIQSRSSFRFLNEALQSLLVRSYSLRKNLDRHRSIEFRIKGEVDLTHAAGADLRADFVAAEMCAW